VRTLVSVVKFLASREDVLALQRLFGLLRSAGYHEAIMAEQLAEATGEDPFGAWLYDQLFDACGWCDENEAWSSVALNLPAGDIVSIAVGDSRSDIANYIAGAASEMAVPPECLMHGLLRLAFERPWE